jgi:hypothetical protein
MYVYSAPLGPQALTSVLENGGAALDSLGDKAAAARRPDPVTA